MENTDERCLSEPKCSYIRGREGEMAQWIRKSCLSKHTTFPGGDIFKMFRVFMIVHDFVLNMCFTFFCQVQFSKTAVFLGTTASIKRGYAIAHRKEGTYEYIHGVPNKYRQKNMSNSPKSYKGICFSFRLLSIFMIFRLDFGFFC